MNAFIDKQTRFNYMKIIKTLVEYYPFYIEFIMQKPYRVSEGLIVQEAGGTPEYNTCRAAVAHMFSLRVKHPLLK